MGSVELRGVKKRFGGHTVIHGVDLAIDDGEFVALVGPSGCGKSTLLRIVAGLEDASEGEVSIAGYVVNDLTPRERNIAMVFQSYALYPHMNVAENMAFNLKLSGKSKAEIEQRIAEAARMLDLSTLLKRRPSQLSGGQRQRVAMGRAIVRNPSVYLFDEPLSNLDAKLRVQMRSEIKALHQKVHTTAIYVTHDQIEAMTLADRVVVLNGGRIEQAGRPMELYRRPENLFVAGFIGSPAMNFIDATGTLTPDGPVARLGDGTEIRLERALPVKEGQPLVIGLRPENLALNGEGTALSGPIQLIEPTGAQTHIVFKLAGQGIASVVDGSLEFGFGENFKAAIAPALVHVFDKATGRRV
ncbi:MULTISPECIES: ABC transporter ATP-binding protein [Chelativorans]|jgi:multiple sugar transport system ATP-binding protein|uniref:Carbohydrate ABC transporter ATP-binding protein, CUT1 family n=1 Tax=Chelativorans sp. (strain BNC1) TaxID=266779 RepID=Q11AN8_CHESB|nr:MULTISPECIES: sn-glycerol-3-phosphate ABC transporter ATP-binding protein UgpC [Chelativorans]